MKTDVLIIGGGPGGCAAAMFLTKEGISPIILEQEEFPRFHIGESMTGEAGGALRRLGLQQLVYSGCTARRKLESASCFHLAGPSEQFRRDDARGSAEAWRQAGSRR